MVLGAAIYSAIVAPVFAVIRVQDDTGQTVTLAAPAKRIVSLAPHITELLFAAGAGSRVVGAAQYSNFPAAANDIPRIGGAGGWDLERIAALHPDLVVAWESGNPSWVLRTLERFGIAVFRSEPRQIEDVATNIDRLGQLAGSVDVAGRTSAAFRRRHSRLRSQYAKREPIRVFYQVWERPLMTVNGFHLISNVIELCGGVNVFADLPMLTSTIDIEAVLRTEPQAIISAGSTRSHLLTFWRRWPQLDAVRNSRLFVIPDPLIARHTPRVLDGAERLCAALEQVRRKH